MNDNFINDILNNEELKEKITKVQSKEELLALLEEYSITFTPENKLKFLEGNNKSLNADLVELNDESLEKVSGGVNPFDVIYEHTFTTLFCQNKNCGYHEHRQGYWLAMDVECPRCKQETLHGKRIFFA